MSLELPCGRLISTEDTAPGLCLLPFEMEIRRTGRVASGGLGMCVMAFILSEIVVHCQKSLKTAWGFL